MSNFVATDVYALLLNPCRESFFLAGSLFSSPCLSQNLSGTPGLDVKTESDESLEPTKKKKRRKSGTDDNLGETLSSVKEEPESVEKPKKMKKKKEGEEGVNEIFSQNSFRFSSSIPSYYIHGVSGTAVALLPLTPGWKI